MPDRIVLEPDRPTPTRRAALAGLALGFALYLTMGAGSRGAALVSLTLAGLSLGLYLLDRSQTKGLVVDARGLHDRWGTISWKDVIDIQRSHAGEKVFLTLHLPRSGYPSRADPRDDDHEATTTRWALEISARAAPPEFVEAAAREWHSKAVARAHPESA